MGTKNKSSGTKRTRTNIPKKKKRTKEQRAMVEVICDPTENLPVPKYPYTEPDIEKALIKYRGRLSVTARRLGIMPSTLKEQIDASPVLQSAMTLATECLIDYAESKLERNMRHGDTTAIIFFLKTKGRERGYDQDTGAPTDNRILINITPAKASEALSKEIMDLEDAEDDPDA
jgi:hypothetical protein